MTFGFEREYFVLNETGGIQVAAEHNLPHDDNGYLAEARGEFHHDVRSAAWLLKAIDAELKKRVEAKGFTLSTDERKLSAHFKWECMRKYGKRVQTDFSMSRKWNNPSWSHAGLHVHFGNMLTYENIAKSVAKFNVGAGLINIPRIVMLLDKEFAGEIKEAKRALGLYKLKGHGFEYRSLPASTDVLRVAEFLKGKDLS